MTYIQLVNAAAKVCGQDPVSDDEASHILWEYTGYPCFFMHDLDLERQLLKFFRYRRDHGCNPPHPLAGP